MYVTGRGTQGFGTILPALLEARRQGLVGEISLAATTPESAQEALERSTSVAEAMSVDGRLRVFPEGEADARAYLAAAEACRPDAVIVSVPDHLHQRIGVELIERGMHCLMVKPLAPTAAEARSLSEAARSAGVVAEVEFHKRYDEANLLLRDRVRSGKLGHLLYAVIEYSQQKRIPRDVFRSWAARTDIFQYLGVHYVDLLYFATGFLPRSVSCWGQKDYLISHGIDTFDAMQTVIAWRRDDGGDFVSTHVTNWIDPDEGSAVSDQKINVVGTHGRFQSDQKHRGVQTVRDGAGVEDINPYFSSAWFEPELGGLRYNGYGIKSILQFLLDVEAVRDGRTTVLALDDFRPTFEAGVVSCAVIDAARESVAREGAPVAVDL